MSVELVDLDLAGNGSLPDVSIRRRYVRAVARLDNVPLGTVTVENAEAGLDAAALHAAATERLGARVWAGLASRRLRPRATAASIAGCLITVVVCTRDRARQLEGCLEALARQSYSRHEVLVVDNASRDDATRQLAERFGVRYVHEARPGLDWARNLGLAEARGSIVAYTDDDARPEPGWLDAIAAGFASTDVDAVTGLVLPAELETGAQRLFEDGYGGMGKGFELRVFHRRGRLPAYRPECYGVGCNMAFRKAALERLDGFDPALDVGTPTGGGGDLDMFQRLVEANGAIVYRPDAVVRHLHRRTREQLRRQLFDNGRAYSAVLTSALLRARGRDRLRVVARYLGWLGSWHLRRMGLRAVHREPVPFRLLLAEFVGAFLGPVVYWRSCRSARSGEHKAGP